MAKQVTIKTTSLFKRYPGRDILKGCNIQVEEGTIYGLLGVNGSGKTTFFKLLCGLLNIDSGEVKIIGKDIKTQQEDILGQVGLLIETPIFYEHLSAQENLAIHLAYMNKEGEDIDRTLKRVGLDVNNKQAVSTFSFGMRQRLAIARAIIHHPKLLIFDEPINGLDPVGIRDMRLLFKELIQEGATIIISSHILSELEHVADAIGVLVDGRIAKEVSMADMKLQHPDDLEDYFIDIMTGGHYHA